MRARQADGIAEMIDASGMKQLLGLGPGQGKEDRAGV